jgi:hypothetical protein
VNFGGKQDFIGLRHGEFLFASDINGCLSLSSAAAH